MLFLCFEQDETVKYLVSFVNNLWNKKANPDINAQNFLSRYDRA